MIGTDLPNSASGEFFDDDFGRRFASVSEAHGFVTFRGPMEVVGLWANFVEDCVAGFEEDYDDYLNYLSYRNWIAVCDSSPEFSDDDTWRSLTLPVGQADAAFAELIKSGPSFRPDDERWWYRTFPRYGDEDFVRSLGSVFPDMDPLPGVCDVGA